MPEDRLSDHIFICSRWPDAPGASDQLRDWLRIAFGRDRVVGNGYGNRISARTAVCVAVIGPHWASAENLRRLHQGADSVRDDLVRALATSGLAVIPTLVEGAVVPNATDLPAELVRLFDVGKVRRVTEDGWEDDVRRLIAEIANAAQLVVPPDLDTLLRGAGAAQQRVAELGQTRTLQANQIQAVRQTLDILRYQLSSPGRRAQLSEAFAALARGDFLAAEQVFERDLEMPSGPARGTRAEAALNVANLALMHDVAKAVSFYWRALQVNPADIQMACRVGEALMLAGNVRDAEAAFAHARAAAEAEDSHLQFEAHVRLGDVQRLAGAGGSARAAYETAAAIAMQRLARDPAGRRWQDHLTVSEGRIAELGRTQGDGPNAQAFHRRSLALSEGMVARSPANPAGQRVLAEARMLLRDFPGALAAYRRSLALWEGMVARDPANTEWQRDLGVSHDRIAGVLLAQGDAPGALAACHRSLAVREALVTRDPANPEWQRDLAESHFTIGDVLVVHGDFPGALAAYRRSVEVFGTLSARHDDDARRHYEARRHKDVLVTIGEHTSRAGRRDSPYNPEHFPTTFATFDPMPKTSVKLYIALGDSISIDRYPELETGMPNIGAASLFSRDLRARHPDVEFHNLTADGATTESVLREQLPRIQDADDPAIVTITVGGNDLLVNLGVPHPPTNLVEGMMERLTRIVDDVIRKVPNALVLVGTVYDPSDNTGTLHGQSFGREAEWLARFNEFVRDLAGNRPNVLLADIHAHFMGHGITAPEQHRWYWSGLIFEPSAEGARQVRALWMGLVEGQANE